MHPSAPSPNPAPNPGLVEASLKEAPNKRRDNAHVGPKGFDELVHDLAPKNRALLAERDRLQVELDNWHRSNPGPISDMPAYRSFLESIGYLQPEPGEVKISTSNVDS